MQDIASALDMKAASLYNHIASKQDILQGLLMSLAEKFTLGMEDIQNSSLGTLEKLEALVSLHVKVTLDNRDAIALITGEWVHLQEPQLSSYKKQRSTYEKYFRDILHLSKTENHIDDSTDIDLALYSILSSLHWLYSWVNKHKSISQTELEHQLKKILLKGILS